ncbi:MAG: helix-turn-helix transcriptional regulator [Lawsonibacter sp.]|nr:helix-turn-helix transcriptional regulator [Lawsonibacter sp.]
MDTLERIRHLMKERNCSAYRLAIDSGLPQSTISNLFNRNNVPTIQTLEAICGGLGITMGQFFADNELVELTDEQKEFFNDWATLSAEDKLLVKQIVQKLKSAK